MPEGDTVFRAAAGLHRALAGKPLTRGEIRWGTKSMETSKAITELMA